jgi:hypothetical protein
LSCNQRKPNGQSQYSALLDLKPKTDRIQNALACINTLLRTLSLSPVDGRHLAQPTPVEPRISSRDGPVACQRCGNPRVEAVRLMMEERKHSIDVVAQETGFSSETACAGRSSALSGSHPRSCAAMLVPVPTPMHHAWRQWCRRTRQISVTRLADRPGYIFQGAPFETAWCRCSADPLRFADHAATITSIEVRLLVAHDVCLHVAEGSFL